MSLAPPMVSNAVILSLCSQAASLRSIVMSMSPDELRAELHGLFAFPITPFTENDEVNLPRFREHVQYLLGEKPNALFVCGGTGEFFSLDLNEYRALVKAAVEEASGTLPVLAGVGYGTRLAVEFASAAQDVGADGLLVLPPYLIQGEQEGLYDHFSRIAASTHLGLMVYQRDNAILSAATVSRLAEISNIVGFKDGHGDMERLAQVRLAVGDRLVLVNGMPTAEIFAGAYFHAGVSNYSSAVFNFVPGIARAFYRALVQKDDKTLHRLMEGFYRPFADLRDRRKGYAIALIKSGVNLLAKPVGRVRPPLIPPSTEHEAELKAIVEHGLSLVMEAQA